MHGTNIKIKIIGAQQARIHIIYKYIKLNLLKTNTAVRFNKMCRTKHLMPKHIRIKYLFITDLNYIYGHILPTIRFYHNNLLLYVILLH
jgi:hypothetical protein